MFDEIVLSLYPRVRNSADFGRVELLPLLLVKFLEERYYRNYRNEVDERVTDVALVLDNVRKGKKSVVL